MLYYQQKGKELNYNLHLKDISNLLIKEINISNRKDLDNLQKLFIELSSNLKNIEIKNLLEEKNKELLTNINNLSETVEDKLLEIEKLDLSRIKIELLGTLYLLLDIINHLLTPIKLRTNYKPITEKYLIEREGMIIREIYLKIKEELKD